MLERDPSDSDSAWTASSAPDASAAVSPIVYGRGGHDGHAAHAGRGGYAQQTRNLDRALGWVLWLGFAAVLLLSSL